MARTPFRVTDMKVVGTLAPQVGDITPPTVPQNVSATAINAGRVDVSWTASTDDFGVSGYQIFRNGSPLTTTSGTTHSDTTCQPSTAYSYVIVAFDAAGNNSAASVAANATTPANASPMWQSIPAQTLIIGNAYLLQLTDYCTDADLDTLTFSITSGTLPSGIELPAFGTRLQGTPTTAGQTPTVTVRAADAFHTIDTTIAFSTKTADVTAPPVPTGLAATAISTSQIDVSWNASTDAAGSANEFVSGTQDYRLYRSTDGTNFSLRTTQSGLTYSDTSLAAATTYHYKVSARDSIPNESAQSSSVNATTQGAANGAPFILYVANTAGPRTGGEANNGTYIFITLTNAGVLSAWGVTNFVTVGGVNVSGYCALMDPQNPKLTALGYKVLAVQVGALTGLSDGTAYAVAVTVNGLSPSNTLSGGFYRDVFGEAFSFTPQPGSIFFVDPVNGNNANAGTFASPYRDLQSSNGAAGAMKVHTSDTGADGAGVKPGTHVVLRGGTYTAVGLFSRWCAVFRITGTPATGAANRGPICIMSYPGSPGSNAPELAYWDAPAGAGGGFNGNDTARANATPTAYSSQIGWAKNLELTRLKIRSSSTSGGDGGPVNCQNRARDWRVIDCDLAWPHAQSNPQGRSAGVEGSPINGRFYGLHIHDIYGVGAESNTQHGFYFDGYGSGTTTNGAVASGNIAAFCYIHDITFGNAIQFYDGANGAGMDNNTVAYNWTKTVQKHSLNIADNTRSVTAYNNIFEDAGEAGIRVSTSALTGANGVNLFNNVVYGWGRVVSTRGAFSSESTFSGSMRLENNIFMQTPSHAANSYFFYGSAGSSITVTKNRWYDPDGRLTTKPSQDSTGSYGNPGLASPSTGDFSLAAGSACIDTGNTPTVTVRNYSFTIAAAPQGAGHDIGPYER